MSNEQCGTLSRPAGEDRSERGRGVDPKEVREGLVCQKQDFIVNSIGNW